MKINKSYTYKLDGNTVKTDNVSDILNILSEVSDFVFEQGSNYWFDFKNMYHECRNKYPEINSKIMQNFLQLYRPIKGRKLPKHAVRASIILDNQNFNIKFDPDTKLTNYWLRFGRKNYPLRGKRILQRIKDISCVQHATIFIRKNHIYCKLTYVEEVSQIIPKPENLSESTLTQNHLSVPTMNFIH